MIDYPVKEAVSPPTHITAKPGARCAKCDKPLPQAVGNPQWLFKSAMGRGISVFCSDACMQWGVYRVKERGTRNTFSRKDMTTAEIDNKMA